VNWGQESGRGSVGVHKCLNCQCDDQCQSADSVRPLEFRSFLSLEYACYDFVELFTKP
jgi:hypothetical protein